MEHSNSNACLPPGWTVKVNVRKSGKKDKFYFPPSTDRKFNSLEGVFRYLDNAKSKASMQSIRNNSEDVTMKPTSSVSSDQNSCLDKTVSDQQIPRCASKRLAGIKADDPPQELKRTRACRDVGKQPREEETVIIADNAKSKASMQSIRNNSEDVTMKPTSSVSSDVSSCLDKTVRDQHIPRRASKRLAGIKADDPPQELKRTRACRDVGKQPHEDETVIIADKSTNSLPNDQAKQFNALDRPEAVINADSSLPPGWTVKVKVRKNGQIDKYYFHPSSEKKFNSMAGVLRYLDNAKNKASLQSISNNSEDATTKPTLSVSSGQNSGVDMIASGEQIPRRSSKRLAAIKADQLKTTRVRQDVVKQSGKDKAIVNAVDGSETNLNNKSTENTMENNATAKDCACVLENGHNAVAKLDCTCKCECPLTVILTDPCIAFAIQTLTGETFEASKDTQISSELKTIENCETSTEEHGKKINVACDDSDGRNMLSSLERFAIKEKHVDDDQIDNAHKNAGSSEKKLDISKMALSVNLCKSGYNCSQYFGEERRDVC